MPKDKKATRTAAATKARKASKTQTGPRAYLPAPDPAPKPIDALPVNNIRIIQPVDRLNLKYGPLKRKRTSTVIVETSRKKPRSDISLIRNAEPVINAIESKWHAVAEFYEARGKGYGMVANEVAELIGKKYDVTGKTLRGWVARIEDGQSLMRKEISLYRRAWWWKR